VGPRRRPGKVASASLAALALAAGHELAPAPAAAGGAGDPFDLRAACSDDFRRFCAELGGEARRGEIVRCLASHQAQLSPACRVALGEEPGAEGEPVPAPAHTAPSHRTRPPPP